MGLAAAAMSLAFIGSANATPVIAYSTDGGATFTDLSLTNQGTIGTTTTYDYNTATAGNIDGFQFHISIGTNSPGNAGSAQILSSALSILNGNSSTQNIIFAMSDGGFTAPTAPPVLLLNSHIGGTVSAPVSPSNALSFTTCVTPGASSPTTSCAHGSSTPAGTPSVTSANAFSSDTFLTFDSLTGPYALTEIMNLTLGSQGSLGFQANSTLATVPEPATMALMMVGLLGLTFVYRRRQA